MTHLITGATGNIGSRVVDQLLERGERPRVFVRSAEKARARFSDQVDIVVGDLADEASLSKALAGIDSLLLITGEGPDLPRRDETAAKAAKTAGVRHLVKLSALSAALPSGAASALGEWHAAGEAAVRSSGVAWTLLRPVGFMSNALAWAPSVKADGVIRASTGDGRIAMIHPDDIATVATRVLTTPGYDSQTLSITGPQALSYPEMTGQIGVAIGRPLVFEPISDEQARERLLAHGLPPALADGLVTLWRSVREGRVAMVTDDVERVTGRKPVAFDRWVQENVAAFR